MLALQGAFREHRRHLEAVGARVRDVRLPVDLDGLDGLVLPGGESTTMGRLLDAFGLWEPIRNLHGRGGVLWGTCAGAILLATDILGAPPQDDGRQRSLGLLDATVQRNAFGRQVDSFTTALEVEGFESPLEAVFIRAPAFVRTGAGVQVLSALAGQPVLVQSGRVLASAFHPELTVDRRLHMQFLRMVTQQVMV
ncbi:pyridoxal 5'-phosphate synthase glutaminase subunit PdxT [Deinococcus sp.]|uniref:pyridoxal 5'-phosphate synthase glutaminase subunit PdxT n=1 Tax=Deinococcus sp. TaxID=47478 RepID=UPI002869C82D|nr:pyridoxal 5'-phosphate synthase glutaminase subunit PdxT [Deinococcus sp.]